MIAVNTKKQAAVMRGSVVREESAAALPRLSKVRARQLVEGFSSWWLRQQQAGPDEYVALPDFCVGELKQAVQLAVEDAEHQERLWRCINMLAVLRAGPVVGAGNPRPLLRAGGRALYVIEEGGGF